MKKIPLKTILFGLFFIPLCANAQIVNIEDRRSGKSDTIAWFGSMDLGFNLVENGDAIFTFNGGINAEHVRLRHLFLSFTRFNLVRIDEKDFVNDGFQHLRYNYRVNSRITWEVFGQAQYNEKIRLRFRGLAGTGLRLSLLSHTSKQKAFLGTLYMYEYDEEKGDNDAGEPILNYFRDHRLSTYLAFRLQLGKNTTFASTSYYQPVLTNFEDLRLSSKSSLQIAITEKLKFTTTFSIVYDSRVPESVPNTTYRWTNGVKWVF